MSLPSSHRSMGGGRRWHVSKGCGPTSQVLFVEGGILGTWKEKPRLSASQSSHQGPNQDSGASGRKISGSATKSELKIFTFNNTKLRMYSIFGKPNTFGERETVRATERDLQRDTKRERKAKPNSSVLTGNENRNQTKSFGFYFFDNQRCRFGSIFRYSVQFWRTLDGYAQIHYILRCSSTF